ncbi:hypothetical protein ROE7235_01909 [Roseibaca ekhonensis]|jgi:hypothetical protein|uniref:Flagellar protein n=1 Tax=Roseinatronobacter ekhonensis TaxID=254356 RepID=A0A3B0M847_9RHOB|nr:DUF1217 domain-containing protein [Roseibaca ekhonensis]SUZ32155.1 hypothetical protein ROE7235_01909 [Roseibaca ekhonensis]
MSFQPFVPIGGLAGWAFLKRTQARQEASFANSPRMERVTQSFQRDFSAMRTVGDLVENLQALDVVLGAFGLQEDLENRAFIRKVISDGTSDRSALGNRLADKRYLALAREMAHLAPGGSGSAPEGLADRLISQYQTKEFEIAVGDSEETMRFSLAFERSLPEIAAGTRSDTARWFAVLGDPPTRRVVETALGLPKEFAALDIDDQIIRLQDAARNRFGTDSIAELAQPEMIETITRRFLLMDQLRASQAGMSGAAVALSLLSATG